jgi:type II pantothenate kinase
MKICGIDAGCTDTKSVIFENDFITYNAVNAPALRDAYDSVGVTGARACRIISQNIAGFTVFPEMECAALGASYLTGLKSFLLVSMGTGTSFTRVTGGNSGNSGGNSIGNNGNITVTHLGGSGMGGASVSGLFNMRGRGEQGKITPAEISKIAESGSFHNTDLMIGEVLGGGISETALLLRDDSAANMAKLTPDTTDADLAAGIINMTAQTLIGFAILASKPAEPIVIVGGLSAMKQIRAEAAFRGKTHRREILFPDRAAYAGAIGAALKMRQ